MPIGMLTVPSARTTGTPSPGCADESRDDDHRQAQHDALGDARHDRRQRVRQLHLPQQLPLRRAERLARFLQRRRRRDDAEIGQADRRGDGENDGRDQAWRRTQMKQHQGRDQIDEGRKRLHQVEHGPQQSVEPRPMGRGDAERHADQHAHDGREPDQRDRLHRRLPIAEIGDGDERDDHERRQAPGPVHPIGERRERENDDEKRDVQQDRGEAVDQKVDHRRHRVEESGRIVLQPRDPDLNPTSERHFGLGEPTLQRRPSNKNASAP